MTKRTAEKTLRDEVERATKDLETENAKRARILEKLRGAETDLIEADSLVSSARARLERTRDALETLSGIRLAGPLEEIALEPGAPEETPEPDRETLIAAAVGTDVETVRQLSGKRAKSAE